MQNTATSNTDIQNIHSLQLKIKSEDVDQLIEQHGLSEKINQIKAMGFTNTKRILKTLIKNEGNVQAALNKLLNHKSKLGKLSKKLEKIEQIFKEKFDDEKFQEIKDNLQTLQNHLKTMDEQSDLVQKQQIPEELKEKLRELRKNGFYNQKRCLEILEKNGGKVEQALQQLNSLKDQNSIDRVNREQRRKKREENLTKLKLQGFEKTEKFCEGLKYLSENGSDKIRLNVKALIKNDIDKEQAKQWLLQKTKTEKVSE